MQSKIFRIIKAAAITVLFVLGIVEILFPFGIGLMFYAYGPQFRNAFDVSKFTDQQNQLCQKFHLEMNTKCEAILYCGIATIVVAVLLLWADRRKKIIP
jgi:hypothetical protein